MYEDSQHRIRNSLWVIGLVVFYLLIFCLIEESKAKTFTPYQNSDSDITALLKEGFAYKIGGQVMICYI